MNKFSALVGIVFLASISSAQIVRYDNTTTAFTAAVASNNLNEVWGDMLTLSGPGLLSKHTFGIWNSAQSGNTGNIVAGTFTIKFYDNTVPFVSGPITNPLLGSYTLPVNFGSTPVLPGSFQLVTATGLASLNINLPTNILITQSFQQTVGSSIRYGVASGSNPTTGSSNNAFLTTLSLNGFISQSGNSGNLYYKVEVVPEPTSLAALALGGLWVARRKRNR